MSAAHRLEKRADLLASRLKERVAAYRDAIAPPGQRPPFHTALSSSEARAFWAEHRYDDVGKQVLGNYTPDQIAGLDAWLAQTEGGF